MHKLTKPKNQISDGMRRDDIHPSVCRPGSMAQVPNALVSEPGGREILTNRNVLAGILAGGGLPYISWRNA